jgi:hypothetical protein
MIDQHNFVEMLDIFIENKIIDFVNTAFPAKVVSVKEYESQQFVDVQGLIRRRYEDGSELTTPVIFSVPVVLPSGGGAALTFPIKEGDNVLVIISQRDLSSWLVSNGDFVSAENTNRFRLTDAMAIPSIYTSTNNLSPNPSDVELKFNDSNVVLGEDGSISISNTLGDFLISPSGDVTVSAKVDVAGTTNSTVQLNTDGSGAITNQVGGSQGISWTPTGDIVINGVTFSTSQAVSGVSTLDASDDITTTGGDVVVGDKTFKTHVHFFVNADGNVDETGVAANPTP